MVADHGSPTSDFRNYREDALGTSPNVCLWPEADCRFFVPNSFWLAFCVSDGEDSRSEGLEGGTVKDRYR